MHLSDPGNVGSAERKNKNTNYKEESSLKVRN